MWVQWNGTEPRAVVPTQRLLSSRDVEVPTPHDMIHSPYPLGLGLHAVSNNPNSRKTPLTLFYVSDQAARDRSPAANRNNAAGVESGWYVIATPGTKFQIVISRTADSPCCTNGGNAVTPLLLVDGINTYTSVAIPLITGTKYEFVVEGFCEKRTMHGGMCTEQSLRQFEFMSAQANEHDRTTSTNCDIGTIRMECKFGKFERRLAVSPLPEMHTTYPQCSEVSVVEKEKAKGGKTVAVKKNGEILERGGYKCNVGIVNVRLEPKARIKIFVREASWLRSRRLIDDNYQPCTYPKFLSLLASDSQWVKPKPVAKSEQRLSKRAMKKESQAICNRNEAICDTVDLTGDEPFRVISQQMVKKQETGIGGPTSGGHSDEVIDLVDSDDGENETAGPSVISKRELVKLPRREQVASTLERCAKKQRPL